MRARRAVFAALLFVPAVAGAQAGGFGPIVLQLPASTRAIGFGNAYVAVRDPEAVFYNPAQLGNRPGVAMSIERYGSIGTAGAIASSYVFGPIGFGIGAQMLDYDVADAWYPSAAPNGEHLSMRHEFPASSLVAATALEMAYKGIRWGVAGKFAEDRTHGGRDGVLLGDVGAAKEFWIGTAGVTVQNLGVNPKIEGTSVPLPTRATLGYGFGGLPLGPLDVAASTAVSVRRGGRVTPAGGVEFGYLPIEGVSFSARVGARLPEKHAESPMTAGASFTFDHLTLDYAFEPYHGRDAHRIGLRIR